MAIFCKSLGSMSYKKLWLGTFNKEFLKFRNNRWRNDQVEEDQTQNLLGHTLCLDWSISIPFGQMTLLMRYKPAQ